MKDPNIIEYKRKKYKATKLKVDDKEFISVEIGTINAPKNKTKLQRDLGIFVANGSIKSLKALVSKSDINCIIYYGIPESDFITDILNEAIFNNKIVYTKTEDIYNEYIPTVPISENKKLRNLDKEINKRKTQEELDLNRDINYQGRRIPEERKIKMRRYLRYYQLETPVTEPEWVEAFEQLAYYIKHEIPYAFDTNLYTICEECGELVHRGTEEEHICYCDIVPKRLKIDYIINGED